MLTLPVIVEREAQPYVAMRRVTPIPFEAVIAETLPKLFALVKSHDIVAAAAVLQVQPHRHGARVGDRFRPADAGRGDRRCRNGRWRAAGRPPCEPHLYGSYGDLREVTAVLLGWAEFKGHRLDMERTTQGDRFVSRREIYMNGPNDVSSPEELATVLAFKLADG